jgi:integrase
MYGGLRRGEMRALRVCDVDLAAGLIRVERSWDDKQGAGETKGRNKRRVPIPSLLRQLLREQMLATGAGTRSCCSAARQFRRSPHPE